MNKMLTATAAAFFALTALFGSGAEAGFSLRIAAPAGFSALHEAGCGGGGYFRSYRQRSYRSVSRRVKPEVHIASKPAAEPVTVAKAEPETKVEAPSKVAETENSSISSAEDKVAEVKSVEPAKKIAAVKDVGCKKFFPSVGMTLSVSCE